MPDVRMTGRTRQLAVDATVVAGIALALAAVVLRLWNADLGVPFVYLAPDQPPLVFAPDAEFYLMLVKGGLDHGWFLVNPSLGAPFGQELHDLPHGMDNLNLLVLQVLGLVLGDPFATVNVFYLLTFAGIAASAYLVTRRLGLSRLSGAAVALLFAFLPYHFARGTAHLLLAAYWMVPVGVLLIVAVVSDRPPFTRATPEGWALALRDRRALGWFLACAALASTGTYYAAITITLLVPLVLVDYLARGRRRVLAAGGAVVAAIVVVAALNLVPTFVYWVDEGRNTELVKRGPSETEVNGLKISQLVLPVEEHRIGPLAEIQADATRFSVLRAERGQALGLLGAAGFVVVLGTLLVGLRRRPGRPTEPTPPIPAGPGAAIAGRTEVLRVFGVGTVVAIVVGATSGLSLVLAGVGLSDIRSWNRVSVFIGFFGLVAVGFGIDWLRDRGGERFGGRRWWPLASVVAVAAIVGLGVLDQVSPAAVPDYDASEARFASDARFFARVEEALPDGAAVYTLPYLFFPESGTVAGVGPYDNARGFLHTDDLEWSWGGVVGTEADWAAAAAQSPPEEMLDRVVALGFRGLVLDRRGYDGDERREAELVDLLGPPTITSPRGDLAFWDLREWAADARTRLGRGGLADKRAEALADRGRPRELG